MSCQKPLKKPEISFVLGTGRTGTSLLYNILNASSPELRCFQEPSPGPILNIYSKIRSEGLCPPFLEYLIFNHLRHSRKKLFRENPADKYVEINPFLFGLGDLLQKLLGEIRIVHMTRHPLTFITSSINFTPPHAGGPFIHTSFWKLNGTRALGLRKNDWQKLTEAEKWAWRWVYINQKILALRDAGSNYFLLRYEDLTDVDNACQHKTIDALFRFLNLKSSDVFQPNLLEERVNASSNQKFSITDSNLRDRILEICGPLMKVFGYGHAPRSKKPLFSFNLTQG